MIIKPELLDRLGINPQVTAKKRNELKFLIFRILTLYLRYRLHFNTPNSELYISAESHRVFSYSFYIYSRLDSFITDIYSEVFPQSRVDEYFIGTTSIMSFTIENESIHDSFYRRSYSFIDQCLENLSPLIFNSKVINVDITSLEGVDATIFREAVPLDPPKGFVTQRFYLRELTPNFAIYDLDIYVMHKLLNILADAMENFMRRKSIIR